MSTARGFTLIELSVVLVIIGLLTGGILAGQTLLRQSKINGVVQDAQTYTQAIQQFQQKYGYLPGDMPTATTYWTAAGGSSSDNWTTSCYGSGSASSTATCNGNGNGQIYGSGDSEVELPEAWKQLSNAQLIGGNYTGVAGSGTTQGYMIPGVNAPAGRLENSGYTLMYLGPVNSSDTHYFPGVYGHVLMFGLTDLQYPTYNSAMTTVEAQAVDNKFDDGLPATGTIRTWQMGNNLASASCATSATASTAAYATTTATGQQCSLIFITGF